MAQRAQLPQSNGTGRKPLIEHKNIVVPEFAGALTDTRAKFLEWVEDIKDRTALYDQKVAEAMSQVEQRTDKITEQINAVEEELTALYALKD